MHQVDASVGREPGPLHDVAGAVQRAAIHGDDPSGSTGFVQYRLHFGGQPGQAKDASLARPNLPDDLQAGQPGQRAHVGQAAEADEQRILWQLIAH